MSEPWGPRLPAAKILPTARGLPRRLRGDTARLARASRPSRPERAGRTPVAIGPKPEPKRRTRPSPTDPPRWAGQLGLSQNRYGYNENLQVFIIHVKAI